MAGHSAKKNKTSNDSTLALRWYALIGVNVTFLLWRVGYHYESFGFWSIVFSCAAWAVYLLCYSNFRAAAESGIHNIAEVGEYWTDVFWVTLVAQTVAIMSDWGWLVLLLIPGYLMVAAVGRWLDDVPAAAQETAEATNAKKAKKKVAKSSSNFTR
eukprot:TRINITY_DN17686_c0_g1_i1.p1 TRINITY_DN17686_c0_g1~~TRINITY_DN17686_c0_g1_i1.p1  ORF type:complete len:156 (-),score=38.88 TRINITY_DN17686_c0_g1_i1:323-790(-)